ncbi:MAG: AAA family ATPase [Dehalococcoidia bacterium]
MLYRLPELLAASPGALVFVVEGEKDADRLASLGLVATTSPMGAGKWRDAYATVLKGSKVVIIPDNDPPGKDHADDAARSIAGEAATLKMVELPGLPAKGDITDWLDAGHTKEELLALVETMPIWKPAPRAVVASPKGLNLTPLAELLAEPPEAVSWLWESTLPTGGLSILAAKPKVGKSTLARNLALAVARGEEFLGRATTQGPVIYLALEEKRGEVRGHFERMEAVGEPIYIHVGGVFEEALAALRQAVEERHAVLAIVDPLLRMIRLKDSNDYAEVTRALEPWLLLARETDCHIMVIHHEGKGAANREMGDGILGSTALLGAVDTGLIMRKRDDKSRTLESIQRYGVDIPKTVMAFDPARGTVEAAGTVEDLELEHMCQAIGEALSDTELTEPEIRELTEGRTQVQSAALRKLVAEGSVTRVGAGRRGDPYRYKKARSLVPTICGEQENKNNEKVSEPEMVGVGAMPGEDGGNVREQETEGVV